MSRWIAYKNGQFGAVYHDEKLEFDQITLDESTPDQMLFTVGILRLTTIPPEFPDIPHYIVQGPIYEFVGDGTATVTERFIYRYTTFEEIRQQKIQEWYVSKDNVLRKGVAYNGAIYDLRFRNISYLSLLSSLIVNDQYPDNFKWFDVDGNVVTLNKNDCLELIKLAAQKIVRMETKATTMLKKLEGITDIHELMRIEIILEEE